MRIVDVMPQNVPANLRTLFDPDGIKFGRITVLDATGKHEALNLLTRASELVGPIMEKRRWRVKLLCEFAPKDRRLLGRNWGRGSKVEIRLRPANDSTSSGYVILFHVSNDDGMY